VDGFLRVLATTLSTLEMRKERAFIHNQAEKVHHPTKSRENL
jgi:hypothetical protein